VNPALKDLQALYRAARRQEEPTRADRRAVRAALLGLGAVSIATNAVATSGRLLAIVPGGAKVLTLTQIVGYVGLGVALGTGVAVVGVSTARRPSVSAVQTPAAAPVAKVASESARPQGAEVVAPSEPAPTAGLRHTVVQPQPMAPSAPSSLVEESRALAEVQSALSAQNPGRALQLLAAQDREFSVGALGQERAAARVFALCEAGLTSEAESARARFLQRFPQSPLAKRVSAGCEK